MLIAYVAVCRSHTNRPYHQKPIDPWDIDLPMKDLGCMLYFDLREVRQLDDLREQLF
jgi:hypothetical protein